VPKKEEKTEQSVAIEKKEEGLELNIVYATQKGTAKKFAAQFYSEAQKHPGIKPILSNVKDFDFDELHNTKYIVFVVSTYTDGEATDDAKAFYQLLEDTAADHRVPKSFMSGVRYAIFGCGNSVYGSNFNKVARQIDEYMGGLSAKRIWPTGMGDYDSGEMDQQFKKWTNAFWRAFQRLQSQEKKKLEALLREQKRANAAKEEEHSESEQESGEMVEVEDMGKVFGSSSKRGEKDKDVEEEDDEEEEVSIHRDANGVIDLESLTKPMVHPVMEQALTKQGYRLIGSHSGVKLCRWTKAMLRGRGGCYKHTFYGITSFQCMEMTPSLACANKCVFCWRHHTNPVAKEWKWKVDKPEFLVKEAVENHLQLIKSLRGVPGVQADRFIEAQTIRHCALSLVGEPILYPYVNELVSLLHSRAISTFMVTNAQFPEKLDSLIPVTQLYLSIDAATKDTLKAIDRPLFEDFWERFIDSIKSLRKKGQRTVFRLTLVKDHNMEEIKNYAELVMLGVPDFIEVKGVTYCGTNEASHLTIQNTPFHVEVVNFCKTLCAEINEQLPIYEIACEHEHSLCVLIANKKKFYKDDKWHTWIDYSKFFELESSGKPFASEDYMEETPSWAIYGAAEKGFDPNDVRFQRRGKPPTQGC